MITSDSLRRVSITTTYHLADSKESWKPDNNFQVRILTVDEPWGGPNNRVLPEGDNVIRVVMDTEVGPGCDEDNYLRDGRFISDEYLKAYFVNKGKKIMILD